MRCCLLAEAGDGDEDVEQDGAGTGKNNTLLLLLLLLPLLFMLRLWDCCIPLPTPQEEVVEMEEVSQETGAAASSSGDTLTKGLEKEENGFERLPRSATKIFNIPDVPLVLVLHAAAARRGHSRSSSSSPSPCAASFRRGRSRGRRHEDDGGAI